MKCLIIFSSILISFSSLAQSEKIHGVNGYATVDRTIEGTDTSYTFCFQDTRYQYITAIECVTIDLLLISEQVEQVIETGDGIVTERYQITKTGKGATIYVGKARCNVTRKFFRKAWAKRFQ